MARLPTLLVRGALEAPWADDALTPVANIAGWLRRRMPEFGGRGGALADRVLVVKAETGSGKSTVLPVEVFRILRSERAAARLRYSGPGVVCTQPRVLTAQALARDVSAERLIGGRRQRLNPDMVLGVTVGYQTGPACSAPGAGLVFATAGVLAAQLRDDDDAALMGRYRFILVDEAHERSLAGDVLLAALRAFYLRNEGDARLPFLLLTSATFDPRRYTEYFGVGPGNVAAVRGRSFPIEEVPFEGPPPADYPRAAAQLALRLHAEGGADPPGRGDVLIFVPGAPESQAVFRHLAAAGRALAEEGRPILALEVNSEVVAAQRAAFRLLFAPPGGLPATGGASRFPAEGRPPRRVVVATVVAETGLTIDSLKYVIDCGWYRGREAYYPGGVGGLVTLPAAETRVHQRRGRAGRLFPGVFCPLYGPAVRAALPREQVPDILTAGPEEVLLAVVREQQRLKVSARRRGRGEGPPAFRVEDLDLLDPPAPEALADALAWAAAAGFLAPDAPLPASWPPPLPPSEEAEARAGGEAAPLRGFGLTPLGFIASAFSRTPVRGVRALLAGYSEGAAGADLATIAAFMGTRHVDLFARPAGGAPRPEKGVAVAFPAFAARPAPFPGGDHPDSFEDDEARVRAAAAAAAPAATGGGPQASPEEEALARARLLVADHFLEAVLIFDAFAAHLDAGGGEGGEAWCAAHGLSHKGLLELAGRRGEVAEEAAAAGLDPFRNEAARLSAQGPSGFGPAVRRLKRCLAEALRDRLLRRGPDGAYASAWGQRVAVPPLLAPELLRRAAAIPDELTAPARRPPAWVATDAFVLRPAPPLEKGGPRPLRFTVAAGNLSVLDGFVDVDPAFLRPAGWEDGP